MPRPLAFDREQKLQQAMILFWKKGFDGTSIQDLVNELNINKFSLYNTYGDKQKLYHEALTHYSETVVNRLLAPLNDLQEAPLERIRNYFRQLVNSLKAPQGITGCFMQNAGLEIALKDRAVASMLKKMLEKIELALKNCIDESLANASLNSEKLPSQDTQVLAKFLVVQGQGLIVYRKAADAATLNTQVEVLLSQIDQWQ